MKVFVVQDGRSFRVYHTERDLSFRRNYTTITAPDTCTSDGDVTLWILERIEKSGWKPEFRKSA